jgi:YVTN family beta-propeller protein
MPPVPRVRLGFVSAAIVTLFLLSLLLNGGAPIPLGASSHTTSSFVPSAQPGPATPAPAPTTVAPSPIGHVAYSPLLNYNSTLPDNFDSSVWDWAVGPGTLVPSTGDIWLSANLNQTYRGPEPTNAPAVVYDPATNAFVRIVPQLPNTSDLLYDSANGWIYSTDPLNNTVGVFDPTTDAWLATIPVGSDPTSLALDPTSGVLFVANAGSSNLSLINTTSGAILSTDVPTGTDPDSLAIDPGQAKLFVGCAGSTSIYTVNTTSYTVNSAIPLASDPGQIAVSTIGFSVAVTLPAIGDLYVVNSTSYFTVGIDSIGVGSRSVLASPDETQFVVASSAHSSLITVNASTGAVSQSSIPVGSSPAGLTADPNTDVVYSWSAVFRNLTGINPDTGTVSGISPTLGGHPTATAYDPTTDRLFVANSLTESLSILNATTLSPVGSPVGFQSRLWSLADDPSTSTVYVGLNGSVAAVNAETGQPTGLNNSSRSGPNLQLLVDLPAGVLWALNNASGLVAYNLSTLKVAFVASVTPSSLGGGAIALDPATDQVFALATGGFPGVEVAVVDGTNGTLVSAGVAAGTNLTALVYDPADEQVYAMGTDLAIINATNLRVVDPLIPLPPHVAVGSSLAFDPSRDILYATTSSGVATTGQLTVLDGASVDGGYGPTGTIYTGFAPTALLSVELPGATGQGSGVLFVANTNSGTLSVIATSPALMDYFEAAPQSIDLGQSTQFLLEYNGGAGVSTITYSGLPTGCVTQNSVRLNCTPTEEGVFAVTVTITDAFGAAVSGETDLSVAIGVSVSATFSIPTFPQVDVNSSISMTAHAAGGNPGFMFEWNFGDGSEAAGDLTDHTYLQTGQFVLTLTALDSVGGTGSASWAVVVNPPPEVSVTASEIVADVNHTIALTATPSGGTGAGGVSWDFGDGTSMTGSSVTHYWTNVGTFQVSATYEDAAGIFAVGLLSIHVGSSLGGQFSVSGAVSGHPEVGDPFTFTFVGTGGTAPYSVLWKLGDGSEGTGTPFAHSYSAIGNYTVNVTVTDATGASENGTLHVEVYATPSTNVSSSTSNLNFPLGLFLGVLVGAALAAVVVYAVGPRRRKERPPQQSPVTPFVPPAPTAEWKED